MDEPTQLTPRPAPRLTGRQVLEHLYVLIEDYGQVHFLPPKDLKIMPTRASDGRKVDTLCVQFGDDDRNVFYIDVEGIRE